MLMLCVDSRVALRRVVVAFNPFRANWDGSKSHFVRFEGFCAAQQRHGAGRFYDDDLICLNCGGGSYAMQSCDQNDQESNAAMKHICSRVFTLKPPAAFRFPRRILQKRSWIHLALASSLHTSPAQSTSSSCCG